MGVNKMKTYGVTFDMKEGCTNCVEVHQVATYRVTADAQRTFFHITVEADSSKNALVVAALYIKKFIIDKACNMANKVANMAMENY